jgi:hypothetical protein
MENLECTRSTIRAVAHIGWEVRCVFLSSEFHTRCEGRFQRILCETLTENYRDESVPESAYCCRSTTTYNQRIFMHACMHLQ